MALTCMAASAGANEADSVATERTDLLNVNVKARVDWQNVWHDSHTDPENSGFEGKYIMLRVDGRIVDGLTYSWRQRINRATFDSSFFDSTDWLNVTYNTSGFDFSAGKQVVAIGGWEYDRNPADLYSTSLFWQNIPCFQLGASVGYQLTPADHLLLQASQSMFRTPEHRNMYGYNLMWTATHGLWRPMYSVNMTEYTPGKYINYIMLGNRFDYNCFALELDLMNRYSKGQRFFLDDCSVVADFAWHLTPAWKLHAKYTYDVNHADNHADLCVLPGTELNMAGGGVEFYPLRKKRTSLRLHANCYGSWGKNANVNDVMQSKTVVLDFGVTWDMNLLNLK